MIVNRLKDVLPQLVLPNQTSFVPCRYIQNNVIIVQEAIHLMSKFQEKQGCVILKIDLEKAYDRLKWSFIEETLHLTGIPETLVQPLMKCITPSSNVGFVE